MMLAATMRLITQSAIIAVAKPSSEARENADPVLSRNRMPVTDRMTMQQHRTTCSRQWNGRTKACNEYIFEARAKEMYSTLDMRPMPTDCPSSCSPTASQLASNWPKQLQPVMTIASRAATSIPVAWYDRRSFGHAVFATDAC